MFVTRFQSQNIPLVISDPFKTEALCDNAPVLERLKTSVADYLQATRECLVANIGHSLGLVS